MKTFFQIAVSLCLLMLFFSLTANFVASMDIFPNTTGIGIDVEGNSDALSQLTGLSSPTMNALFVGVTGLAFLGAVALSTVTHSVKPIGIHLFGAVFWTSWVRMTSILGYGGYVPDELLVVFTVGVVFVFIAAIIGMLTGGG